MDYKVILSENFLKDLQGIIEFTAQEADFHVASKVAQSILDRVDLLGRSPYSGKPVKGRKAARRVTQYTYLIFYDVNEEDRRIEVLRAWHGARAPGSLEL